MLVSDLQKLVVEYDESGVWDKRLDEFKPNTLGQGFGYKSTKSWEQLGMDEVCYVPEYGYEEFKNVPSFEDIYSKRDFIDICNGNEGLAQNLYEDVDWQSPETLWYEWNMYGTLETIDDLYK